ncbi:MAG: lipoyl(octanoyl) transferase LipB, partial [bacterium]|nr:lipoyl(octanoyl) transferase LipB [bacterium]
GPGQLVGYPVLHLGDKPKPVDYVRKLERALIATLADFGIEAWAEKGYTGVWTAAGKVAAIGVRMSRKVTMHGFALNVDPDVEYFGRIIPCGITRPVTTMSRLLGRKVTLQEAVEAFIPRFVDEFSYAEVETQLGAFARGAGTPFDVDQLVADGTFSGAGRKTMQRFQRDYPVDVVVASHSHPGHLSGLFLFEGRPIFVPSQSTDS